MMPPCRICPEAAEAANIRISSCRGSTHLLRHHQCNSMVAEGPAAVVEVVVVEEEEEEDGVGGDEHMRI